MLIFCKEIQEATASEPLNLDEEYAMQQSWREDADKLTFIICYPGENLRQTTAVTAGTYDSANAMMGDVNMFISISEDSTSSTTSPCKEIKYHNTLHTRVSIRPLAARCN